jgi:hypothetical protein
MNGAARRALSFIPLFGFAILVFGQFASVIVIGPAYSVESIGGSIESKARCAFAILYILKSFWSGNVLSARRFPTFSSRILSDLDRVVGRCHIVERRTREFCVPNIFKRPRLPVPWTLRVAAS